MLGGGGGGAVLEIPSSHTFLASGSLRRQLSVTETDDPTFTPTSHHEWTAVQR